MKRVFAFISLFAIALVMFGFGTSNVKAAEPANGKWFENPYLLKDEEGNVVEIPMYIMNSISTTFPQFFDYEGAKGTEFEDKNLQNSSRAYGWNGVKVIIPQFSADGATGKSYGLYPYGGTNADTVGIGYNIYTVSGRWNRGAFTAEENTGPGLSSLTWYLFNDTDDAYSMKRINLTNGQNSYVIFDGEGKGYAGLMLPDVSTGTITEGIGLGTEFCWDENGVGVVANADASNCAKIMVDGEEDDLNKPILDENGEPTGEYEKVQVESDDPDYIKYRFVWAHLGEAPENLNNSYLGEGWKADNWDFYNEETGVAVAFFSNAYSNGGSVGSAELAADETIESGHVRAPFADMVIPAGGLLVKYGNYLETIVTGAAGSMTFREVQAQAYLYGREEGYAQTVKCYNYAGSDLAFAEKAVDGLGYTLLDGTNIVEITKGASVELHKLINIAGVSYAFADENDPYSFQSAVWAQEDLDAKKAEFVEAEKALLREEVAYEAYQTWLDSKAEEEASFIEAKEEAKAALDAAAKVVDDMQAAAENDIKNSEDAAVVAKYNELVTAIEQAQAKITDTQDEIKKLENAEAVAKAAWEESQVSHKDTLQYKGYNTSLSDAKAAHDSALAVVASYAALGLGILKDAEGKLTLTTADVAVEATQDATYEDWTIVFANAELEAAENAFVAAIGTDGETAAREALIAAFQYDSTDTFGSNYLAVVKKYIDTLVNLNIANIAMHDYVEECLEKTTNLLTAYEDAQAATTAAKDTLGAPATEDAAATGLYAKLEEAEAAKEAFIDGQLEANADYQTAKANEATAQAAYNEAAAALGAPSTEDTPATGFYEKYETTVNEVEANITAEATKRAEEVYNTWYEEEYKENIALEFTVIEDGVAVVYKQDTVYANKAEIAADFLADWATYAASTGVAKVDGEYGFATMFLSANQNYFSQATFMEKWSWVINYVHSYCTNASNKDSLKNMLDGRTSWYNTSRGIAELVAFLNDGTTKDWYDAQSATVQSAIADYKYIWQSGETSISTDFSGEIGEKWTPLTWNEDNPSTENINEIYSVVANPALNGKKVVEVKVYNPIVGNEYSLTLEFVTIEDAYDATPVIEVNDAALRVNDPSTFDIRSIAKAYDKVYSETEGLNGNDISSQINFVAPELTEALASGVQQGEFPVSMTVVSASGRKVVTETAVVTIVDSAAPVLQARDVTLNYGEDFHFLDGIYFAYDNVHGNLFDADFFAFVAEQDTVNTLKPGEYTVKVSAMDKSGNSAEVEYVVTVNEQEVDLGGVLDAIEDVTSAVEDTQASVDNVKDNTDTIIDNTDGLGQGIEDTKAAAENNSLVVVATVLAGVAALASVGAVVLVVLKKK